ncbi:kinetochore-associated Ndc80 complex subunit SPC24 NDAI_0H02720 [Naumovozyma dairenensis CBS 421]|uniref:Kinetochore protein Spc24 n=1 Tax=Naumovozyma dairenensis (strain ATCC 10597 / BCRC 20456 / CBS 421 / NBRC 0211 / NRRL Y-12639) TaxID=1071378 RepID=G0WF85_NAUDC|nr:hypothetical protein NDAI_0H02720 [Naumovozyma dairenensis CBS 421]CCD26446.1 hypothetical protein NDAI_0H02720 [Naumovozyma dairenensis CBS 421]
MADNDPLINNLAALLRETRENFDIEHDIDTIININDKLTELKNRSNELKTSKESEITSLRNNLESQGEKIQILNDNLNKTKEESKNFKSKDQLIDVVKELDELENDVVSMRSQLDQKITRFVTSSSSPQRPPLSLSISSPPKNSHMNGLSNYDDETNEILNDPIAKANILRLKLYRSMGIILDIDNNQVLIDSYNYNNNGNNNDTNNNSNNKIDILPLDDDLSDYFKTKYIWEK